MSRVGNGAKATLKDPLPMMQAKLWATNTPESELASCCLELSGISINKKAPTVTGRVLGLTSSQQELLQEAGFVAAQSTSDPSSWLVTPVARERLPPAQQAIPRRFAVGKLTPCHKILVQSAGGPVGSGHPANTFQSPTGAPVHSLDFLPFAGSYMLLQCPMPAASLPPEATLPEAAQAAGERAVVQTAIGDPGEQLERCRPFCQAAPN